MFVFNNLLQNQSGGSAWVPVNNTNVNTLFAGAPTRLLVRGDRNIDLTSNESLANETRLRARGNLHLGNFNPVLSPFDANFSFIGNPYQATVDVNALSYIGDINNNYIYVWDAQLNESGGFVAVETLTGDNTVGSNANEFIQPNQAFFIRNNMSVSTSPSITFTEASKAVSEEQLSTFSITDFAKLNLQFFSSNNEGAQIADAVGLRFSENFQNEVNDADAGKLGNSGENFALVSSNQLLSIEQRQMPLLGEEIQLFINNYQGSNYSFMLQLENWNEDDELFIRDNYLDELTPILPNESFNFSIDQSISASTSPLRFSLVFGNVSLSNVDFNQVSFQLYPNPTKEAFYISGIRENASVSIYDLLGREVLSTNQVGQLEGINIAQLSSGVYLVKVKEGERRFTQKLIKE